jgi:hypothetical protein
MYIAQPSLIQSPFQSIGLTESPNHWCASSCSITESGRLKMPRLSVIIVWVSIASSPPTTTNPSDEKGYGPARSTSHS